MGKDDLIFKAWNILHQFNDVVCDELAVLEKQRKGARTLAQQQALRVISASKPDGIKLKDLAKFLNVTPGAASQMVESLVCMGEVERIVHPEDRRCVRILTTDYYDKIEEYLCARGRDVAEKHFKILSEDELKQFCCALEKIFSANILRN